jgi:ArsR family transcriptional regulator
LGRAFGQVIAVDHNESMLARARQRVAELGLGNVDLRQGELEALPIDDARIDLAVAILVLHHVGQPDRAMGEIARILRPGGVLLIVELAEHQDNELQREMGDLWMGFSPSRLSGMAGQAGMEELRTMTLSGQSENRDSRRGEPSLFAMTFRIPEKR